MARCGRHVAMAALAGALAVGIFSAREAQAQAAQEPAASRQLLRYVRGGEQGAKARNLPDAQGVEILAVESGGLLAVHGERNGWLEVEAPGGFEVWVYGEFVRATAEAGQVEITGSDVRMRPLPSSGTESYALAQHLAKGDRVRLLGRDDASKPLDQDWVRIQTPPGARAWVAASETVPLESGASGAALWSKAVSDARSARNGATIAPASAPAGDGAAASKSDPRDVARALQEAEDQLARERAKEQQKGVPDYGAVRASFDKVLELAPAGPSADLARGRIQQVDALAEAYALRTDLELERSRREAELARRQQAMDQARDRDAFEGRFDHRGWLEQRTLPGSTEPVYVLRWAGDQLAELVCLSGRYDLSVFAGFDLGVSGREVRSPTAGTIGAPGRPQQIDVSRIVVLAGRARGR